MPSEATDESKEIEQKGSSMRKWIIIGLVLILLGAGGFVGWSKFLKSGDAGTNSHASVAEPIIHEFDTFLANLNDPGGKRYLKVTMKAKLNDKKVENEVTTRNFELRDAILMLLSSKEYDDIATSEDKASLKQEILAQLNRLLSSGRIDDLYFTEFLVQ